jgi:hypothetical protein
MVEDGRLIAMAALRLSLKNEVVLRVMRSGSRYDEDTLIDIARALVVALIDERRAEAALLTAVREEASRRPGMAHSRHDYHHADVPALDLRIRLNTLLSERLAQHRRDDDFLTERVREARDAALDEIVQARVATPASVHTDDRERARALELLSRDLRLLGQRTEPDADRTPKRSLFWSLRNPRALT